MGDPVHCAVLTFCLVLAYIPESPASQGHLGGREAGLHMAKVTTRRPTSKITFKLKQHNSYQAFHYWQKFI